MSDILNGILDGSTAPWLSALVLGLMTAISPCPLATNITAVGYIGKDLESRNRVFLNGVFYTLGRSITYTVIPLLIFLGANQFQFSGFFQRYGEKFIGPVLILIGLLMLDVIHLSLRGTGRYAEKFQNRTGWRYWDSLLLGVVFALAFCPYSGVLYFGILVPMTVTSASGLFLPLIFAVATGIPVIVFAWILAFAVSEVGTVYRRIKIFELWFRRVVALLFLVIGVYYILHAFWGIG